MENDDPGISLSTNTLEVREGSRRTYTVKLDAQPVANVTVAIQDGGDVDVNPSSLTFTPQDWNSRQTVTVEAEHDEDTAADQPVVVMHRASGTAKYTGVTAELTVTIDEDDVPSVTVSDRSLTVREGGSNTYTVVLDKEPSTSVTVTVTVPSNTDLMVSPTEPDVHDAELGHAADVHSERGRRRHEPAGPIGDADARGQRRRIFRSICGQREGDGRG